MRSNSRWAWAVMCSGLVCTGCATQPAEQAQTSDVTRVVGSDEGTRLVVEADGASRLYRDGEPFFIKGVGGNSRLDLLAEVGGNALRTWGVGPDTGKLLDNAQEHGLAVCVGYWLEHPRHGADYSDESFLQKQTQAVRDMVERYKHHPAVLMWSLGNEVELNVKDPEPVWRHIEALAAMVKQLDPTRPVMTVVAEITPAKIEQLERLCPSIDILGINSYGGATTLGERYARWSRTDRPFAVTEFGTPGPWESKKTPWGAPIELTSAQKAERFEERYLALTQGPGSRRCVGTFAFLWGNKQETTGTWFGMLLAGGKATVIVDRMAELWSSKPRQDRSPVLEPIQPMGPVEVAPGGAVRVRIRAQDPEGQPLRVRWELHYEATDTRQGGDREDPTKILAEGEVPADGELTVTLPERVRAYRLFVFAYDPAGNAATANLPVRTIMP